MRMKDVKIGRVYAVRVSGTLQPVRIDDVASYGAGWSGTNLRTNRAIRIRSAQRLRFEVITDGVRWVRANNEKETKA